MKRALGRLSRAVNQQLPGALPDETLCGRLSRTFGPLSFPCTAVDLFLGFSHCHDEAEWCLKGLRKK